MELIFAGFSFGLLIHSCFSAESISGVKTKENPYLPNK